jgi:hypothetical protein
MESLLEVSQIAMMSTTIMAALLLVLVSIPANALPTRLMPFMRWVTGVFCPIFAICTVKNDRNINLGPPGIIDACTALVERLVTYRPTVNAKR